MKTCFRKTIAVAAACSFTFSFVVSEPLQAVVGQKHEADAFRNAVEGFTVNASAGRVSEARDCGGREVLVHIQDLHCHPEVQRNIARIIRALDERYDLRRVYVEGASGRLDASWFTGITDERLRNKVLDTLIDGGKLTGAEYYAITSGRTDLLTGADNEPLHTANLIRLNAILAKQDEMQGALRGVREVLEALKDRHLSRRNRKLDAVAAKYRAHAWKAEKYYAFLLKQAVRLRVDTGAFPSLVNFTRSLELARTLDYGRVGKELRGCVASLKSFLPYGAYNLLLERTDNLADTSALCFYLSNIVRDLEPGLTSRFPRLEKFLAYLEANRRVNPAKLVGEERRLTHEIMLRLADEEGERDVLFLLDFSAKLRDYLGYSIAADEYEFVRENLARFKLLYARYAGDERLAAAEPFIPLLDEFYRANLERNDCLLQSCLRDEPGPPAAAKPGGARDGLFTPDISTLLRDSAVSVLVTGGFHTRGLERLLKERNISYIVITPGVTGGAQTAQSLYAALLQEQARVLTQHLQLKLLLAKGTAEKVPYIAKELIAAARALEQERLPFTEIQRQLRGIGVELSKSGPETYTLRAQARDDKTGVSNSIGYAYNAATDELVDLQANAAGGETAPLPHNILGESRRKLPRLPEERYETLTTAQKLGYRATRVLSHPLIAPVTETLGLFAAAKLMLLALDPSGLSIVLLAAGFAAAHQDVAAAAREAISAWRDPDRGKAFLTLLNRFGQRFAGGMAYGWLLACNPLSAPSVLPFMAPALVNGLTAVLLHYVPNIAHRLGLRSVLPHTTAGADAEKDGHPAPGFKGREINAAFKQIDDLHRFAANTAFDENGRQLWTDGSTGLALSPDGRFIFSGATGVLVDLANGREYAFPVNPDISRIVFTRDGRSIVMIGPCYSSGQRYQRIDLVSGAYYLYRKEWHGLESISVSDDGKTLYGRYNSERESVYLDEGAVETGHRVLGRRAPKRRHADVSDEAVALAESWGMQRTGAWAMDDRRLLDLAAITENRYLREIVRAWGARSYYVLDKLHQLREAGLIASDRDFKSWHAFFMALPRSFIYREPGPRSADRLDIDILSAPEAKIDDMLSAPRKAAERFGRLFELGIRPTPHLINPATRLEDIEREWQTVTEAWDGGYLFKGDYDRCFGNALRTDLMYTLFARQVEGNAHREQHESYEGFRTRLERDPRRVRAALGKAAEGIKAGIERAVAEASSCPLLEGEALRGLLVPYEDAGEKLIEGPLAGYFTGDTRERLRESLIKRSGLVGLLEAACRPDELHRLCISLAFARLSDRHVAALAALADHELGSGTALARSTIEILTSLDPDRADMAGMLPVLSAFNRLAASGTADFRFASAAAPVARTPADLAGLIAAAEAAGTFRLHGTEPLQLYSVNEALGSANDADEALDLGTVQLLSDGGRGNRRIMNRIREGRDAPALKKLFLDLCVSLPHDLDDVFEKIDEAGLLDETFLPGFIDLLYASEAYPPFLWAAVQGLDQAYGRERFLELWPMFARLGLRAGRFGDALFYDALTPAAGIFDTPEELYAFGSRIAPRYNTRATPGHDLRGRLGGLLRLFADPGMLKPYVLPIADMDHDEFTRTHEFCASARKRVFGDRRFGEFEGTGIDKDIWTAFSGIKSDTLTNLMRTYELLPQFMAQFRLEDGEYVREGQRLSKRDIVSYIETVDYVLAGIRKNRQPQATDIDLPNEDDKLAITTFLLTRYFDPARLRAIFDVYFNSGDGTAHKNIDDYSLKFARKNPAAFYAGMDEQYRRIHRRQQRKLDYNFFIPFLMNLVDERTTTVAPEAELLFKLLTSKELHRNRSMKLPLRIKVDLFDQDTGAGRAALFRGMLRYIDRAWDLGGIPVKRLDKKTETSGARESLSFAVARSLIDAIDLFTDISVAGAAQRQDARPARDFAAEWRARVLKRFDEVLDAEPETLPGALAALAAAARQFRHYFVEQKLSILHGLFARHAGRSRESLEHEFRLLMRYAANVPVNEEGRSLFDSILELVRSNESRPEVIATVYDALLAEADGKFKEWRYRSPDYAKMFADALGTCEPEQRQERERELEALRTAWEENRYGVFKLDEERSAIIGFTDDFGSLVNLGNPPRFGSCQATYRPGYNHGLCGTISNGWNKALVVFDPNGKFLARRIVRVRRSMTGEFIILQEKTYGDPGFDAHLDRMLGSVAGAMGVRFQAADGASEQVSFRLSRGHSAWDYSDMYGGLIHLPGDEERVVRQRIVLARAGTQDTGFEPVSEGLYLTIADRVLERGGQTFDRGFIPSKPGADFVKAGGTVFFRGEPVVALDALPVDREIEPVADAGTAPYGPIYLDRENNRLIRVRPPTGAARPAANTLLAFAAPAVLPFVENEVLAAVLGAVGMIPLVHAIFADRVPGILAAVRSALASMMKQRSPPPDTAYPIIAEAPVMEALADQLRHAAPGIFKETLGYAPDRDIERAAYREFVERLFAVFGAPGPVREVLNALELLRTPYEGRLTYHYDKAVLSVPAVLEALKERDYPAERMTDVIREMLAIETWLNGAMEYSREQQVTETLPGIIAAGECGIEDLAALRSALRTAVELFKNRTLPGMLKEAFTIVTDERDVAKAALRLEEIALDEMEKGILAYDRKAMEQRRGSPLDRQQALSQWRYRHDGQQKAWDEAGEKRGQRLDWKLLYSRYNREDTVRREELRFGLFYSQVFQDLPFTNDDAYLFSALQRRVSEVDYAYSRKDGDGIDLIKSFQSTMMLFIMSYRTAGFTDSEIFWLFNGLLGCETVQDLGRWLSDSLVPVIRHRLDTLGIDPPGGEPGWAYVGDMDVLAQIAAGINGKKTSLYPNRKYLFEKVRRILKMQSVDTRDPAELAFGLAYASLLKYYPETILARTPRDLVHQHTMKSFNLGLKLSGSTPWNQAFLSYGRGYSTGYNILSLSSELGHLLSYVAAETRGFSLKQKGDRGYAAGVRQEFYDRCFWMVEKDAAHFGSLDVQEYLVLKYLKGLELFHSIISLPLNTPNAYILQEIGYMAGLSHLAARWSKRPGPEEVRSLLEVTPVSFIITLPELLERLNDIARSRQGYLVRPLPGDLLRTSVDDELARCEAVLKSGAEWDDIKRTIDETAGVHMLSLKRETRLDAGGITFEGRQRSGGSVFSGLEEHQAAELLTVDFVPNLVFAMHEAGVSPALQPLLIPKIIEYFVLQADKNDYSLEDTVKLVQSLDGELIRSFAEALRDEGMLIGDGAPREHGAQELQRTLRESREALARRATQDPATAGIDEAIADYVLDGGRNRTEAARRIAEICAGAKDARVSRRAADQFAWALARYEDKIPTGINTGDAAHVLLRAAPYLPDGGEKFEVIDGLIGILESSNDEFKTDDISGNLGTLLGSVKDPSRKDAYVERLLNGVLNERYAFARALADLAPSLDPGTNQNIFKACAGWFLGDRDASGLLPTSGRIEAPLVSLIAETGARSAGDDAVRERIVRSALAKLSGNNAGEGYSWYYRTASSYLRALALSARMDGRFVTDEVLPVYERYRDAREESVRLAVERGMSAVRGPAMLVREGLRAAGTSAIRSFGYAARPSRLVSDGILETLKSPIAGAYPGLVFTTEYRIYTDDNDIGRTEDELREKAALGLTALGIGFFGHAAGDGDIAALGFRKIAGFPNLSMTLDGRVIPIPVWIKEVPAGDSAAVMLFIRDPFAAGDPATRDLVRSRAARQLMGLIARNGKTAGRTLAGLGLPAGWPGEGSITPDIVTCEGARMASFLVPGAADGVVTLEHGETADFGEIDGEVLRETVLQAVIERTRDGRTTPEGVLRALNPELFVFTGGEPDYARSVLASPGVAHAVYRDAYAAMDTAAKLRVLGLLERKKSADAVSRRKANLTAELSFSRELSRRDGFSVTRLAAAVENRRESALPFTTLRIGDLYDERGLLDLRWFDVREAAAASPGEALREKIRALDLKERNLIETARFDELERLKYDILREAYAAESARTKAEVAGERKGMSGAHRKAVEEKALALAPGKSADTGAGGLSDGYLDLVVYAQRMMGRQAGAALAQIRERQKIRVTRTVAVHDGTRLEDLPATIERALTGGTGGAAYDGVHVDLSRLKDLEAAGCLETFAGIHAVTSRHPGRTISFSLPETLNGLETTVRNSFGYTAEWNYPFGSAMKVKEEGISLKVLLLSEITTMRQFRECMKKALESGADDIILPFSLAHDERITIPDLTGIAVRDVIAGLLEIVQPKTPEELRRQAHAQGVQFAGSGALRTSVFRSETLAALNGAVVGYHASGTACAIDELIALIDGDVRAPGGGEDTEKLRLLSGMRMMLNRYGERMKNAPDGERRSANYLQAMAFARGVIEKSIETEFIPENVQFVNATYLSAFRTLLSAALASRDSGISAIPHRIRDNRYSPESAGISADATQTQIEAEILPVLERLIREGALPGECAFTLEDMLALLFLYEREIVLPAEELKRSLGASFNNALTLAVLSAG